jgi:hypothetical protein
MHNKYGVPSHTSNSGNDSSTGSANLLPGRNWSPVGAVIRAAFAVFFAF